VVAVAVAVAAGGIVVSAGAAEAAVEGAWRVAGTLR